MTTWESFDIVLAVLVLPLAFWTIAARETFVAVVSFVAYGLLGGKPVLCLSNLAEHGRNLAGDPRASLSVVAASSERAETRRGAAYRHTAKPGRK